MPKKGLKSLCKRGYWSATLLESVLVTIIKTMMNGKYLNFGSNTKVKFKSITIEVAQNGRFERDSTSENKAKKIKKSQMKHNQG